MRRRGTVADRFWAGVRGLFRRLGPVGTLAMLWLVLLTSGALLVGVLPVVDPDVADYAAYRVAPGSPGHLLGTDELGRDILARILHGARISLSVGAFAVVIGLTVGTLLGLVAGYFRGWVDSVISLFADVILAFPVLIMVMTIVAVRGASVSGLVIGLGIATTPGFFRMSRVHTQSWATRGFVTAAVTFGARRARLLLREVLPMIVPPMLSYSLVIAALVIMAEGSLSFLGYGVQAPQSSWGSMIASGRQALQSDPHIVAIPALVLVITVLAFNVVGSRLDRSTEQGAES